MQLDDNENIIIPDNWHLTHTVSYDERPGIQAVANKYPDYNPTEEDGYIRRDYEYARLGTLSLLAGNDLLTGEAIPLVSQTRKSSDFIEFLAMLPEDRFVFVFTLAHTSWLNMIESFFSKMTKQMLKGIRVNLKEELSERIYCYFNQKETYFAKLFPKPVA